MAKRLSLKPSSSKLPATPWRVNLPANVSSTGKRERRFFKTKGEAETFCQQQRTRLENFGRNASTLTPGQLEQAAKAFERLAALGVSLGDVVADFMARRAATEKSVTFNELFARFTDSKKTKSAAYLRGLKYTLPRFPALHSRIVAEIAPAEIESELDGMTPTVRNSFLRNLRAVFNYGVKREWLAVNPVSKLDFEEVDKGEVQTLAPGQAEALMTAAEADHDLLPYHALGLFAGVRPFELERLEWQHIDLAERHIEITAQVSKTGRRRIIDMTPTLHTWLTHFISTGGTMAGNVTPKRGLRKRLRKIREAAGLTAWIQDVMRHSYASYWLAEHGDINRLTLNMGHESADMLWKHYNRAAKKKDASSFWQIAPAPSLSGKVVSMVA